MDPFQIIIQIGYRYTVGCFLFQSCPKIIKSNLQLRE